MIILREDAGASSRLLFFRSALRPLAQNLEQRLQVDRALLFLWRHLLQFILRDVDTLERPRLGKSRSRSSMFSRNSASWAAGLRLLIRTPVSRLVSFSGTFLRVSVMVRSVVMARLVGRFAARWSRNPSRIGGPSSPVMFCTIRPIVGSMSRRSRPPLAPAWNALHPCPTRSGP